MLKWISIACLSLLVCACGTRINEIPRDDLVSLYGRAPSQFLTLESGVNLHYRDEGKRDGPVLLLIHGTSSSLHAWDAWTKALKNDFRIIRFDLPAHGLTGPAPSERYRPKDGVWLIEDLAEELGLSEFYLAGNSLGGHVAWRYAVTHPDKAKGLILLAPSGTPAPLEPLLEAGNVARKIPLADKIIPDRLPQRWMIRSAMRRGYSDPDAVLTEEDISRKWHLMRHPGSYEALQKGIVDWDFKDRKAKALKSAGIPILVQWGEDDRVIPVRSAGWFFDNVPQSRIIVYEETGHVIQKEAPVLSARDARDFIIAMEYLQSQR